jgi:hypothetical protein
MALPSLTAIYLKSAAAVLAYRRILAKPHRERFDAVKVERAAGNLLAREVVVRVDLPPEHRSVRFDADVFSLLGLIEGNGAHCKLRWAEESA